MKERIYCTEQIGSDEKFISPHWITVINDDKQYEIIREFDSYYKDDLQYFLDAKYSVIFRVD